MVVKLEVNLKTLKGSMQKIGSFGVKSVIFWDKRSDLFDCKHKDFQFYRKVYSFYIKDFCINANVFRSSLVLLL